MKRAILSTVFALCLFASESRAEVSLGANFGATVSFPRDENGRVGVGWPYSSAPSSVATPGIRFGFTGGSGKHEGYLDSTMSFYSRRDERLFLLTGNYQHNFDGRANTFFFTVGGGPIITGNRDGDAVSLMFGGGVGFRQRIAAGAGTFREELRFDFIPGNNGIPRTFLLGVKLGFDLWIR